MNRFLMHLLLASTLLCGFLGSSTEVKAWGMAGCDQKSEEEVKENDGWQKQMTEEPLIPVETSLRTLPTFNRVVLSRPIRLRPTHGGRFCQHHGRWSADGLFNFYKYQSCWQRYGFVRLHRISSSPRFYYVIALRRLLC